MLQQSFSFMTVRFTMYTSQASGTLESLVSYFIETKPLSLLVQELSSFSICIMSYSCLSLLNGLRFFDATVLNFGFYLPFF